MKYKCAHCERAMESERTEVLASGMKQTVRRYECGSSLTIKKTGMYYVPMWFFKCTPVVSVKTTGAR